jgi:3-methyl-2-oxobutanoate hydroxymethyltransferase
MITAYDFYSARFADNAGIDMLLVGDSLGPFMLGYPNTIPVTMDEMVNHCRSVTRAKPTALVVGDLPFGSYQSDIHHAVSNATRLMKEGRCTAVKLEGGLERYETIKAIVAAGIPVMGHIGLSPQSEHLAGGYRVQGRTADDAINVVRDGLAISEAGCFATVVEAVPRKIAAEVTRRIPIATIGIGAGVACDGQVLIYHEVIGMHLGKTPRYVKQYGDIGAQINTALTRYCEEVQTGGFPDRNYSYLMERKEIALFHKQLRKLDFESAQVRSENQKEEPSELN